VIDSGSVGDFWLVVKALSSQTGLIGKAIVDGENPGIYSCNRLRAEMPSLMGTSLIDFDRPMAGSFWRRQSILIRPDKSCSSAAPYLAPPGVTGSNHATNGVRTMRFSRKDAGNTRGATNGRILRRNYHIAATAMDAGGPSIPIEKMNMLQRLRYASDCFFALAECERKKGDRANAAVIVGLMQAGAMVAAKAAPYLHPKLAAMPFEVSQPQPEPQPKQTIDTDKLTIDEHKAFVMLLKKATVTISDEAQDPIPSDEYPRPTARTRPSRASGS
jgi:hypothetical protein